jgi:hypothetical protein
VRMSDAALFDGSRSHEVRKLAAIWLRVKHL